MAALISDRVIVADREMIMPPIRDAGTLVVIRPRPSDAVPEILMTQRAKALRFAGGAMVFPGGVVDGADRVFAAGFAGNSSGVLLAEDIAPRIAAIRETIEECGLALSGAGRVLPSEQAASLRRALHDGRGLEELAHIHGLHFDFAALVPFTRWCPRPWEVRIRYDTRFYIAVVDGDYGALTPDGTETSSLRWSTAQDMLIQADGGNARLLFPTRCTLERLAPFTTIEELLAHVRAHSPRLITPWLEMRDGEEHVCIPDGYGYPHTSRPAKGLVRS